jgi:hypothetical protein
MGWGAGDELKLESLDLTGHGILWMTVSSFIGAMLSYAGFNCQQLVSGATFALISVSFFLLFSF